MRLSDRLNQSPRTVPAPPAVQAVPNRPAQAAAPTARPRTPATPRPTANPSAGLAGDRGLSQLKDQATEALFDRLGNRLGDTSLSEDQLAALVSAELDKVINDRFSDLPESERRRLTEEIRNDTLGYGPLQRLLDDEDVTEIMVNGPSQIYVEKAGRLHLTPSRFASEAHLRRTIERIVSQVGRRIDEASPLVDARLPDGSRVNAVIPPLALDGSTLTIRKFSKDPLTVPELVRLGTLTPQIADFLQACVKGRLNILISGGTGSGKTTLLNTLTSFVPSDERIITIEDAAEIQAQQPHVVRWEARPANIEGKGEIAIRDLVRNALRARPDRVVVGEVRGSEALDMLQAMNTGHEGSLSTIHANSPRDATSRLETLMLMSGVELPVAAIRAQVASAIDLFIHVSRMRDGSRRVTSVTEVMKSMEGQVIGLQDIFQFDYDAGMNATGWFLGKTLPTGIRPDFSRRLGDQGIEVDLDWFKTADGEGR